MPDGTGPGPGLDGMIWTDYISVLDGRGVQVEKGIREREPPTIKKQYLKKNSYF